jgi:hypothetical protein
MTAYCYQNLQTYLLYPLSEEAAALDNSQYYGDNGDYQ